MTLPVHFTGTFIDLSGGLNTDASPYTILDKESPDLLNMRPQPLGPVTGRSGTGLLSEATGLNPDDAGVIAKGVRSMHRYYKSGILADGASGNLAIITINDKLCSIDIDNPDTDPVILTTFTDSDEIDVNWEMVTFKNWVFLTTEKGKLYRTNGVVDEVYLVGKRPAEVPVFTPSGTGGAMVDGTYYYTYTEVHRDGLGESPEYEESTARIPVIVPATTAVGSVSITIPAVTGDGAINDVVERRIYRTTLDGGEFGRAYRVFTQADNLIINAHVDTLNDDDIPSSSTAPAFTSQTRAEPPLGACLEVHQNRLWLGRLISRDGLTQRRTEVAFSNVVPEEWEVDFALNFENSGGEDVNAIASHSNVLLVFGSTRVAAVSGIGIETGSVSVPDFRTVELGIGPGAFGPRVVQRRNGRLYTMNKDDVWEFEGLRARPISEFRIRSWIDENVDQTAAFRSAAVRNQTQYRVTFPSLSGTGDNDTTLIYDSQSRSFYVDTGYTVRDYMYMASDLDTRQLWSSPDYALLGFIVNHDTGNSDFVPAAPTVPTSILRRYRTKDFSLGQWLTQTKQYMLLQVGASIQGNTLEVTMRLNQESDELIKIISLQAGDARWDQVNWDQFNWAYDTLKLHPVTLPQTAVGTTIGFIFQQDELEDPFEIQMFAVSGQYIGVEAEPL